MLTTLRILLKLDRRVSVNSGDYFVSERFDPFAFLMYLFRIKKKIPITLGDLERAANEGKWVIPESPNPL